MVKVSKEQAVEPAQSESLVVKAPMASSGLSDLGAHNTRRRHHRFLEAVMMAEVSE